jgi:hypothetical protein
MADDVRQRDAELRAGGLAAERENDADRRDRDRGTATAATRMARRPASPFAQPTRGVLRMTGARTPDSAAHGQTSVAAIRRLDREHPKG